jgi:hypothetical protein
MEAEKLYYVGHTVNSQWFLEQVEKINIKYYIKHSSPFKVILHQLGVKKNFP